MVSVGNVTKCFFCNETMPMTLTRRGHRFDQEMIHKFTSYFNNCFFFIANIERRGEHPFDPNGKLLFTISIFPKN